MAKEKKHCSNCHTKYTVDWNEEEQCWQQNEFYGEKHPVDMVIDGDAIDGLKIK